MTGDGGVRTFDARMDCDLVMKGGITSGVVFPKAISAIAQTYRLHSVGGTSAGAIGAAMAVAAEHWRQTQAAAGDPGEGFRKVEKLGDELATGLRGLFQPAPVFKRLFAFLLFMQAGGGGPKKSLWLRFVYALLRSHGMVALVWALPGIGILLLGASKGAAVVALGLLVALIGAAAGIALALARVVSRDLPKADYGICPGVRVRGAEGRSFGEWIADNIDDIAGLGKDAGPLLIGALHSYAVAEGAEPDHLEIAAMTTDITSHRPYRLPLVSDRHYFSRREMERVMPKRIVDAMCGERDRFESGDPKAPADLYLFPAPKDCPVFVVARMSLCFPGLISAVPLWRRDLLPDSKTPRMVRCLFSDGGLSSNFPVHFFDAILPSRPTLGIALEEAASDAPDDAAARVRYNAGVTSPDELPTHDIGGVADFAFALLDTAKDWQDTLRSLLRGYNDRYVYIALKPDEGGLNLSMEKGTIDRMVGYGAEAGERLCQCFKFDQHRRRRAEAALPKIHAMLGEVREVALRPVPGEYVRVLETAAAGDDPALLPWRKGQLVPFMMELVRIAAASPMTMPAAVGEVRARVKLRAEEGPLPK